MSDIGLFANLGHDVAIWLAVTLLLGGPAAIAAGRALARSWRPFGKAIVYIALLAAAADFLCYALFNVSALPIYRIVNQAAFGNIADAAIMCIGYVATFATLLPIAFIGWRATRARQMKEQYPFLQAN